MRLGGSPAPRVTQLVYGVRTQPPAPELLVRGDTRDPPSGVSMENSKAWERNTLEPGSSQIQPQLRPTLTLGHISNPS